MNKGNFNSWREAGSEDPIHIPIKLMVHENKTDIGQSILRRKDFDHLSDVSQCQNVKPKNTSSFTISETEGNLLAS